MARTVVLLTLLLGGGIGAVQVLWDYNSRLENQTLRIQGMLDSNRKAATKAAYTFDTDLAFQIANGLLSFPSITRVTIQDDNADVMTDLTRFTAKPAANFLTDIIYPGDYHFETPLMAENLQNQNVGTLYIEVSPHHMAEEFIQKSITILMGAVIESFVISVVLLFFFHQRVTRPLQVLARDFRHIDPQAPHKSSLTLPQSYNGTEFEEVTDAGNSLLRIIGKQLQEADEIQNVLERQRNETERYLKIAEAIILEIDEDGHVQMINQRGLDVLGYSEDEVIGKDWFSIGIPENIRDAMRSVFHGMLSQNPTAQNEASSSYFENDIITKTGQVRRIYWNNVVQHDEETNKISLLSSGQDITERKRMEDALRTTESSLRAIIEATSEGFVIIDLETFNILDINSAIHLMLGYMRDEMLNRPAIDFVHLEDRSILAQQTTEFRNNPHRSYELRLLRRDGTPIPVEINASSLVDKNGIPTRSVGFVTDISQRRQQEIESQKLEKQLRQAQKMETIGTLAGGIAHDLNNILTPILGYSSLLTSRIPKEDPNHNRIVQISKSANRAADLIKQILSFSRKEDGELRTIDLVSTVSESIELLKSTAPTHVNLTYHVESSPLPVLADGTQIQQLLLNLGTNAIQAIEDEGDVHISLNSFTLDANAAATLPNLKAGRHLSISVSDTGCGMDEVTLSRIFDPFFTTKKSGKGTGLGLAMAHKIVQHHSGEIQVESTPGVGTTFRVFLPISESASGLPFDLSKIEQGDGETLLIVDDETENLNFIEDLLTEANYACVCFTDPQLALEDFQKNPEKFDLLITDQAMPKMNGNQLVEALHLIRTDFPVLMMSGYTEEIDPQNVEKFGIDRYLSKPVSPEILSQEIKALLSS